MTTVLQQVSDSLSALVANASPYVVRIEARRRFPATGIVWAPEGLIVTAHHVIERESPIRVGLADGRSVEATLVGRDPGTDLAVLRAQSSDLTPPTWAEAVDPDLQVGHLVLALGRPQQTVQATLGVVSVLGESWRTPGGSAVERYVQTDVVMYPGFSGGPLVNAAGHVVGLNTSALLRNLSLTIPALVLQRLVPMLVQHGRVRRGFMGVTTQRVRLPAPLAEQLGQRTGLLLTAVDPQSPAEQGGFMLGDTLIAMRDTPIRQHDDLVAALDAERIGVSVVCRIIRGGQIQERSVVLSDRPA